MAGYEEFGVYKKYKEQVMHAKYFVHFEYNILKQTPADGCDILDDEKMSMLLDFKELTQTNQNVYKCNYCCTKLA